MFKHRLTREVVLAVVLKLLVLSGIYFAFFDASHRVQVNGSKAAQWLLSPAPPASAR